MHRRGPLTLAAALLAASFVVRPLGAQTVFQVEGGGNSITGGYGSRVQFWSGVYEGWIGAGYTRGWRVGAFAKRPLGRDTLRGGFDVQPLGVPTDLFSGGSYLLTQGLAWRRKRDHFDATLFAGATGAGAGAPFVNTARAEKPLGLLSVEYKPLPGLRLQSNIVVARRQTILESGSWSSQGAVHTFSATGGVGANKPFGAISWRFATRNVELRTGYTDFAPGFRRADAPMPNIAEPYHENVLLTLRAPKLAMVTIGHQNFRQEDTASATATLASLDQIVANVKVLGFTLGGGAFQTTTAAVKSVSTFNSASRELPFGTNGTVMYFQTFRHGSLPIRTMQAELREPLTRHLSVSQLFSQTGTSVSGGLGAQYSSGFTTIAFDYQNYYVPLREPNPFMRALTLTIRLQLGNSSANIGTAIDPFGRVTYAASGSTYLYMGGVAPGIQPLGIRFERFVIRGLVRDESGAPVEGAALDLGGEIVTTNSRGEFFLRTKTRRQMPLRVAFDDFLAVGNYEVVNAPGTVVPGDEDRAEPVYIVLRVVNAAADRAAAHRMFGLRPQGEPRAATAAPRSAVPLPPTPVLVQSAAAFAGCEGVRAALRQVYRTAREVADRRSRAGGGWHLIMRPLPINYY